MIKQFVFGVAALSMAAGAVADDPPTGSRLGGSKREGVTMTSRDQQVAAQEMAACLYNKDRDKALALLQSATAKEAEKVFRSMSGERTCMGMVMSNDMVGERIVTYPMDILRGMLAERALRAQASTVAALPPLPLQQKRYVRPWFAATERDPSVDEMSACIADTNPAGVMALVKSDPAAKDEAAAFSALGGNLGACLGAGAHLQAGRQALRAALADALFQRMNAPDLSTQAEDVAK